MRSLHGATLSAVATLLVVVVSTLHAQSKPAGGSTPPLAVQATCDVSGKTPVVRVQLANRSDKPTAVVAGFTEPKEKTSVVNTVEVITIRQPTGADEVWMYINPKFALAEGPPWVVTLAPGASHELVLPLGEFMSTMTYANLDAGTAGGARFVFHGRPAPRQATWTGRVETVLGACG